MALITTAELDAFRQTPPGAAGIVASCMAAAEGWITGQLGFSPASATVTGAYFLGDGTPMLKLPVWPVTAVAALTLDGVALGVLVQGGVDTGQPCYLPQHGRWIERRDGSGFTRGSAIKVTYTAGWATIPDDLKMVAAMLTWVVLEERNRVGMTGKSIGPEQINQLARDSSDYGFITSTLVRYGTLA